MNVWTGTSGFSYDHWRSCFYPEKLSRTQWLSYYAGRFSTVELNSTFYRLPSERAVGRWRESTPGSFRFAVKASRFITHVKRLRDCGEAVRLLHARVAGFGRRLGPVLYQLPPAMRRNDERLASFLGALPKRRRHVFEFRHESWMDETVFRLLRRHGATFCVFDHPTLRCPLVTTSATAYLRFHGHFELYGGGYPDRVLREWAKRIVGLQGKVKDAYVYFNNDEAGHAVRDARRLRRIIEGMSGNEAGGRL